MRESGYYPPGAEFDPNAPYNEVELPEKEVEVTVSITLSKTIKVYVNDYYVETEDDGYGHRNFYDFSECDLHKAVEKQVILPHELAEYTERIFNDSADLKAVGIPRYLKKAVNGCLDWQVDEMEVVLE